MGAKLYQFPERKKARKPRAMSGKSNVPFFLTTHQVDAMKIASAQRVARGIPRPAAPTWTALMRREWVTYPAHQRSWKVVDRTYRLTAKGRAVMDMIRNLKLGAGKR